MCLKKEKQRKKETSDRRQLQIVKKRQHVFVLLAMNNGVTSCCLRCVVVRIPLQLASQQCTARLQKRCNKKINNSEINHSLKPLQGMLPYVLVVPTDHPVTDRTQYRRLGREWEDNFYVFARILPYLICETWNRSSAHTHKGKNGSQMAQHKANAHTYTHNKV